MTDDPIPITDGGPNPSPLPGYRLRCQTAYAPGYWLSGNMVTGCQQYLGPPVGVAVRAKG